MQVDPAFSNTTQISQTVGNKVFAESSNYTLTGYYRVKSFSGEQGTDHWGTWSIEDHGLAWRTIIKGNTKGWQKFEMDCHDTDSRGVLSIVAAGNGFTTFDFEIDNLSFSRVAKKGESAKNVVENLPTPNFINPSFEKLSHTTLGAANWTQERGSDLRFGPGNASVIASDTAKDGKHVL